MFSVVSFVLLSSFIALWSERIHGVISIFQICWYLPYVAEHVYFRETSMGRWEEFYKVWAENSVDMLSPFCTWWYLTLMFLFIFHVETSPFVKLAIEVTYHYFIVVKSGLMFSSISWIRMPWVWCLNAYNYNVVCGLLSWSEGSGLFYFFWLVLADVHLSSNRVVIYLLFSWSIWV